MGSNMGCFKGGLAGRKHKDALPSNNIFLSYSTYNHIQFPFPEGKVILFVHTYPCETFASIPIRAYHKDLNLKG
jgi:hypothetical protein